MKNIFELEVNKIAGKKYVDRKAVNHFLRRLKSGSLTRSQNAQDHFCSFFLPINIATNSVYIGHHINSGLWLPPGGHIEETESPFDSVNREMLEELDLKTLPSAIELFDLGITKITRKMKDNRLCKIHYDFWYLVHTPKIGFDFDKSEFYIAGWFSIEKALKKVNQDNIIETLHKLKNKINGL